jgi:predicted DNA-binding antitoxin AbrB/MazE fold protein
MSGLLKAVYRNGVFIPEESCDLPENSRVELLVQGPLVIGPEVTDEEERAAILRRVTERMTGNPLPREAPRFTREELHDRR